MQEAGVAGIALYETNDSVLRPELAPLIQAIHSNQDLAALPAGREWASEWPMDGLDANCGMDGHSCLRSLWLSRI